MGNQLSGKELLDATQEAVIGAADNVETIIKNSSAGGHEPFYLSAEFWVGMAFVLVVWFLAFPLRKMILGFFKQYIAKETNRITDAEKLKNEARILLSEYEEKQGKIGEECAKILQQAERNNAYLKKQMLADMQKKLQAEEKTVKNSLELSLSKAEDELIDLIGKETFALIGKTFNAKIDDKMRSRLIDESIKNFEKL